MILSKMIYLLQLVALPLDIRGTSGIGPREGVWKNLDFFITFTLL